MKKPKLLLIIPLLIISILPVLPAAIPRAHALTGLVCLTDTATTGCPTSAPVLFASQGSQLMVQVQIAGSDPLNGFNIQIKTDNTVLQAADASLAGSIIGSSATVVLKCLDGTLVSGPACDTTDTPGTLHFAAVKLGPTVAGSGLLFTAVYNVVSKSPGINVSLFAVTISNGTGTADSENMQGATFSNLTDFGVTASPASLSTPPNVVATSTITFASFGGFTDFITITVTPSAGLTASTADAGLFLAPDGTVSTTLSVSSAVSGSYSVDVTGTGSNPAFTHTVTVPVSVASANFSVSASPASLSLAPGNSGTSTISVGSIAGFAGTVMLTATSSLTTSFSASSVAAPGSSILTITAASGTAPGSYMVTVTGTSGLLTHSTTVAVTVGVPDFSLQAVPAQVVVFRSGPFTTAAATLNLASINNFAATVSLTATINFAFVSTPGSSSLPFTLNPTATLVAGGTAVDPIIATITRATAGTGLYLVTVTAVGGGKTHTATIKIWVIDYTITARDTTITMINKPGTIGQDPLSIGAIGAPFNATGFSINPGFTEGTAQFPVAYYLNSGSGLGISSALGLDTSATSKRCFLTILDSAGNLVQPVISGGKVVSFAGPLVHLNGDQFGFPANFNGCRFDSFWYVDPLNGNTLDQSFPGGLDTNLVTVEPLTTTPNGTFTAVVCLQAGSDINCINITINMVAPPASPAVNQFNGRTATVSLAAGGQLALKVGVTNPSTVTEYVQVTITAVSSDGTITITGTSGVVAIPAFGKVNNIPVNLDFSTVAAGTTFNLSLSLAFGVAPHYLTVASTSTIGSTGKLTGSVIVTP